jgi:hypothetical protein
VILTATCTRCHKALRVCRIARSPALPLSTCGTSGSDIPVLLLFVLYLVAFPMVVASLAHTRVMRVALAKMSAFLFTHQLAVAISLFSFYI